MEKEIVLKWLRECSELEQNEICENCPFNSCEDCGGALMQAAADVIEEM